MIQKKNLRNIAITRTVQPVRHISLQYIAGLILGNPEAFVAAFRASRNVLSLS